MDQNSKAENNEENINLDKFSTHRGEFVPVSDGMFQGKKVTAYAEFIEDEEDAEEKQGG